MFLKCENISFEFQHGSQVLKNISFSLEKSKTLAIVGASGSGKSTLLRIISGILPSTKEHKISGAVLIENLTPKQYSKTDKLGFMFQEPTLMPNLTVKKNIELPSKIKKVKNHDLTDELINTVGLNDYSTYLPKQLSGGMKTRVALARSFATKPELLLLDEPFSSLDIAWKSKLYIELEKLRELTMTTVIIVTHDVQEALLLADHVIVLNNSGSIETTKEIFTDYSIMARVNDISIYMESVYQNYMLPIQDAIIKGQSM